MKKLFYKLILLFILIIPIKIKAYGITNYYIDLTVLNNGDINVKEIFTMDGTFNGMNRIINFRGNTTKFDGSLNSFKGSNIYNGNSIIINEIKGIPYTNSLKYEDINNIGDTFKEVVSANKGNYGVYTKDITYNGVDLLIYNPSNRNKAFYIDYTITNMGIVHNDIAELGFNIFTNMSEYINNLEMYINIQGNKEMLKVWAHGPLWGESQIIDNDTVKLSIKNLNAYTGVDVRVAFDKSVLSESNKKTYVDALDKIIELETKQANLANQEREKAKELIKKQETKEFVYNISKIIWFLVLLIIIYNIYKDHDKEYKKELETEYFRDFPSTNSPTTVGYLIRKNITNDDLSASILMLIYNKVLSFEEIKGKKNDYTLEYHQTDNLSETDKKLVEFIFNRGIEGVKDNEKVTLSALKLQAEYGHEKFLRRYTSWKTSANKEAESKNFFENKNSVRIPAILYSIIGLIIGISSFDYVYYTISEITGTITIISSIISIVYFSTFTKRSKDANLEYIRWMGLKHFMEDFGTMDKKELPEIVLWEKYLVYAVTLGCADKLAKDMKIKAKELEEFNNVNYSTFDYYRFNTLTNFNRTITKTMTTSVNNAYNARSVASSNYSSGSGSGGGFSGGFSSGGGGSFGGGGGGGRF